MARVLYVGDPHARPDSLEEMGKLIHFVRDTAKKEGVEYICFLGDQFHNHSIIHLSVLAFWRSAFEGLKVYTGLPVIAMVGNHDMSGKFGDFNNAMMLYDKKHVAVIDQPRIAPWGVLLVPYQQDPDRFIQICRQYKNVSTVVCHQTFEGSRYENGFYAKDGIDPNLIPQKHVISGHIHTTQSFGKVFYPGSPRWLTVADANTQKGIWVVDHDEENGSYVAAMHPTDRVCRPIYALTDRPEEPVKLPEGNADIVVDVYGDQAHVRARSAELEKLGARVRQFPTLAVAPKVKESDGLAKSFQKFIGGYKPKHGTDQKRLLELAHKRISWMKNE